LPRIPTYQPNQVDPVQTTDARFRAYDNGGGAMGGVARGLQDLGQAGAQYAETQGKIEAQNDDTQARKASLEYAGKADTIKQQFGTLQGANAREQQAATLKQLDDLRNQTLSSAANPRMRRLMEERLGPMYQSVSGDIAGHALQQQQVERKGVLFGAISQAQDEAAGLYSDASKFPGAVGKVREAAQEYAQFAGLGEGSGAYVKQQVGGVYANAALHALTADDVDMAQAIFQAHGDDMTFEQRNQVFSKLHVPLQDRADDSVVDWAMSGGHPPTFGKPVAVAGGTFQAPVAGRITSRFGEARGGERHSGLDIAAPMGAAIHPIAGGVVEAVMQDDRAGRWVKVKHPDGTTSTYAHMGNQSVKVGDAVSPDTVLGTVGVTGHTTGPHVHLVVRNADGERVDPEKVIGGRAAGGQVIGSPSTARNWDQAAVLQRIAQREDLSPEARERITKRAITRMNRDESVLADQQSDAADQAALFIAQRGGKVGSTDEIPKSIASRMKPSQLAEWDIRFREAAQKDADAKAQAAMESSPETLGLQIALRNPDMLSGVDLPSLSGRVPNNLIRQAIIAQASYKNRSDADRAKFDPTGGINSAIARAKKLQGLPVSDGQYPAVFDTMKQRALQLYEQKKGIVTPEDYDQAFRDAFREVRVNRSFAGIPMGTTTIRAFEATSTTIPKATREQIVRNYQRANGGKTPDEAAILSTYRAMKAGG